MPTMRVFVLQSGRLAAAALVFILLSGCCGCDHQDSARITRTDPKDGKGTPQLMKTSGPHQ